jgi:hypothetical protein
VNVALHQRAESSIYHAVPFQRLLACEVIRDDSNSKVPATVTRSGVAGVPITVVDDLELNGLERSL